eukprot:NODE_19314_length_849_cov_3.555402.p1 GENE.NODE_19314_length_849_cov_3.555402~~NODE_19314_length_849_cov_3.555402.p1  ORF type:complete len:201 (-),score=38.56 NODE_19314_length_849_cov_3.555402:245-847(-)
MGRPAWVRAGWARGGLGVVGVLGWAVGCRRPRGSFDARFPGGHGRSARGHLTGTACARTSCGPLPINWGLDVEDEDAVAIDLDSFERNAKQLRRDCASRLAGECAGARTLDLRQRGAAMDELIFAPAVPPGHRLMPEDERLETLASLRRKLAELDGKYACLPLKIDTEGARRRQRVLREKIGEIEDAVRLFSRSGVLVEV